MLFTRLDQLSLKALLELSLTHPSEVLLALSLAETSMHKHPFLLGIGGMYGHFGFLILGQIVGVVDQGQYLVSVEAKMAVLMSVY
jgi:hypothetical protein